MGKVYKAKASFKGEINKIKKAMNERIKITVTPHKEQEPCESSKSSTTMEAQ